MDKRGDIVPGRTPIADSQPVKSGQARPSSPAADLETDLPARLQKAAQAELSKPKQ